MLILDTYFHVVVHFGKTISAWRNAGYHEQQDYENLKELLEVPKQDAADLIKGRLALPIYVECDQGTSQARFLYATIDPTTTHTTGPSADGQTVFTEDVNLQVFVDFLKKRVANYDN